MNDELKREQAMNEFVRKIACLNAYGDRLNNGEEVVWDDNFAAAQLWEIIYNARLLTGACPADVSAFHTPTRRANEHLNCVSTIWTNGY
jgi:hypothetical protein